MAIWKQLLSTDYRRAVAAEAAGDYLEAARAYALAGERDRVAEMHLLVAEKATGRAERLASLRSAARWTAELEGAALVAMQARVARAMGELARAAGVVTDADRALLREAAQLHLKAGEGGAAGECLELAGDEQAAAEAYQAAGDVDRLERLLGRDDDRRREGRRLRELTLLVEEALARGQRRLAFLRLAECARLAPAGAAGPLLAELSSRLVSTGTLLLGEPGGGRARRRVGRFPAGLGRDPSCEVPLRDGGVSRRHAEVRLDGAGFRIADCGSRNGTRLGGVGGALLEGEVPLVGGAVIALGEAVVLEARPGGAALVIQIVRGADRGLEAVLSAGPQPLAHGAELRFEADAAVLAVPDEGDLLLRLDGRVAGHAVDLLRGDTVEVVRGAERLGGFEVG